MQHGGSTLLGLLQRHLTAVIVAGLTGATTALITSYYGWPGTISGAAFIPIFTAMIEAIYQGSVDRVAKVVLMKDRPAPPPLSPVADRPPPPPLDPTSRAPRLPKLIQVPAALRWFTLRASPERRRSILYRGLQFGVVASIVGLGIVTAVELWLGGNLSCYYWDTDCSPGGIKPPPPSIVSAFYAVCRG